LIDLLVPLELITCYKLTRLLRAPVLPRAGSGPVSSISTNRYHPCVQRPCAREIFTYAQNTSCCLAHVSRQRRRSRPWCETWAAARGRSPGRCAAKQHRTAGEHDERAELRRHWLNRVCSSGRECLGGGHPSGGNSEPFLPGL